MTSVILFQIVFIKNNSFVLIEIIIFFFSLHFIYQIGYYGLRGTDSYVDYNLMQTILSNNRFSLGTDYVSGWPLLHIFSSITSMITGLDTLLIAKYLPSIISSLIALPLFLLVKNIYPNKNIALFSCLVFGSIPQFINFEALFVREVFGIFSFIFLLFLLYTSKKRNEPRLNILLIMFIIALVLSHHFTSFLFLIFLIIYILIDKSLPKLFQRIQMYRLKIAPFGFYMFAVLFSYWAYVNYFVLRYFKVSILEVFGMREYSTYAEKASIQGQIITLRGNILYYGFFIFQILLSLILLIKLLQDRNKQKIEDTSFAFFLYFCLFIGALSLFFLGSLIFPDRFLPFGWMLGIIPLAGLVFNQKNKKIKHLILIILISFIIFNIYNIDPDFYTGQNPKTKIVSTETEYAIAGTISIPNNYYGYGSIFGPIYEVQGKNFFQRKVYSAEPGFHFPNASDTAIINENLYVPNLNQSQQKSPILYNMTLEMLSLKNKHTVHKICDAGSIYILKWREPS